MSNGGSARAYGAHEAGASITPPRTSYLAEIQRKMEIAGKSMAELEARLSPVLAPMSPQAMNSDKAESPHNAISEINEQLGILNDQIARMLRNLEI